MFRLVERPRHINSRVQGHAMPRVHHLRTSSPRTGLTWDEIWKAQDQGLIKCWENGRALSAAYPDLAVAAGRGELPVLDWKGGVSGTPKMKKKYGSLHYLATWQGLRGEDLRIDSSKEVSVQCARSGVLVTFTSDLTKLDADSAASDRSTS